jgi:hypothetical protein
MSLGEEDVEWADARGCKACNAGIGGRIGLQCVRHSPSWKDTRYYVERSSEHRSYIELLLSDYQRMMGGDPTALTVGCERKILARERGRRDVVRRDGVGACIFPDLLRQIQECRVVVHRGRPNCCMTEGTISIQNRTDGR